MKRIGHYEVEKEIGRGAMGVVYLAHDPRVRRRLAVKTYELPKGIDEEDAKECRERFIREAQSAGALNHPSIVTIYDVDQDATKGSTYIAMEYVPGRSLQGFLRGAGRMDGARAVQLGTTLAEALHVAHGSGVVHRDIKPGNILIRDSDGMFKLADFGIARFSDSDLTLEGMTLGSPAYMSPEQIRSQDVDGRSDLFSLASVLYEALTGKRPFEGKDLPALAYAVAHAQPSPVRDLVADLPISLDGFFTKAMAKDPEARYQDGRSFATALRLAWERGDEVVNGSAVDPAGAPGSPSATSAHADHQEAENESPSGSYKPRAPGQILQRTQVEQTLSTLPIIPLSRSFGRKEERLNGRSRWADPDPETTQRRALFKGIGFGRTTWVRLLLLAALLAGGMAAVDRWKSLPPPLPGSVVLEVTSKLDAATLRVFSDGNLLYVGGLSEGEQSRGNLTGAGGANLSMAVSSGKHLFQVHVSPRGSSRSYQEQVKAHVRAGETHRLRIVTGTSDNPIPTLKFD